MVLQPNDCRRIFRCWEASTLSILLVGLSAALLVSALTATAQAQAYQAGVNLPFHHFSGASAVVNVSATNDAAPLRTDTDPVPIPGGIDIPPVIHIFAPGPTKLGFQGLDVDPNGITNFNGFSALAYLSGTATDSNNNKYDVASDMRLYRGEYISADGAHHRGSFVFI